MNFRLATPADAEALRTIYAPFVSGTQVSFEIEPPDVVPFAKDGTAARDSQSSSSRPGFFS